MSVSPPAEVTNGTVTYIMLTLFAVCVVWGSRFCGSLSKDDAQIGTVVMVTTGFFAWMLWLCAWMHQWHPLILPEWSDEE
mmetsp:Transcript_23465/g.34442  ORF Transcript_23465/g.34442 Transcript_23465/m.34442 type:complete len:80 (-) Transcript_23465:152-391(-)